MVYHAKYLNTVPKLPLYRNGVITFGQSGSMLDAISTRKGDINPILINSTYAASKEIEWTLPRLIFFFACQRS